MNFRKLKKPKAQETLDLKGVACSGFREYVLERFIYVIAPEATSLVCIYKCFRLKQSVFAGDSPCIPGPPGKTLHTGCALAEQWEDVASVARSEPLSGWLGDLFEGGWSLHPAKNTHIT